MEKRYQVFVSSTFEDLKEERAAVIKCLLDNNCIPVGMEQFPSSNMSQWEYIKKMMEYTDYVVLITAGKYGTINTNSGKNLSYTEEEYDYALEKGIHILSFMIHKDINLTSDKIELGTNKRKKLIKFQDKVKSSQMVKFYKNVDELSGYVATAINQAIKNSPAIGWVRANEIDENLNRQEIEERISHVEKAMSEMPKIKTGKEEPTSKTCPPGSIYFKYE